MSAPFESLGEVARWKIIYNLVKASEHGTVLTYAELGAALDLHPLQDRHTIQMAMRRAAKQSEREDGRALESVRGKGYRIVEPQEHLRLARSQQRKSSKALERGHDKVVYVDLTGLEPETLKAFEAMAHGIKVQLDMARRLSVRQTRTEETVALIVNEQDRSANEIAELKARLERLEQGLA